ncbi:MAG: mandelate racemase/muconate lactonizing enzyme family protein [Candidatus Alcyoniella australis]|nr:mandelate racemase/muconate lactonizing enzyme family protein [Candidatus Alcyoniella australis]
MSRISRIELYHIDIPVKPAFYSTWIPGYPQQYNHSNLLRLYTDDGLIGESVGNAFGHERQGLGGLLGGFLLGLDAEDVVAARQRVREAGYLGWSNYWIENAFWDLRAKIAGKPLYKLLSGNDRTVDKVRVYASTGSLLPIAERRAYLDCIREMGFKGVKLRVHSFDEQDDEQIMREVRAELGNDFSLMVDANQGWRVTLVDDAPLWDLERATRFGKICDDLNVEWIEEPLDMNAYEELAELRTRVKTRIAGGELNINWHDQRMFVKHGSYDILQPDVTFCGIGTGKRTMDACEEAGLQFSPHTWTNGAGLLTNLAVYAAWPNRQWIEYPYEPPAWMPDVRDGMLEHTTEVNPDGTIDVPQEPGVGLRICPRKLRKYGKRFHLTTKPLFVVRTLRERGLKTTLELAKKKSQ